MNLKEWRGFKGKMPCLPPLSTGKQGRGVPRAPAALGRRPWSSAAASGRGKRSRAALGTDSQPQFGQGRFRASWPRRPSANGGGGARPVALGHDSGWGKGREH